MEPIKKILPYDLTDRKIVELCREGKYLDAVKFCREQKQLGLKEAKDHVDSLSDSYGIQRAKGCSSKAAALILITGVLLYFFV